MGVLTRFFPQVLFDGSTKYNKNIQVLKIGSKKKLVVEGIVQSLSSNSGFAKGKVWGKIVSIIAREQPETRNILLLGMGGGTMVHFLRKEFDDLQLTCVEIDQTIVDLAKEHFGIEESNDLRIIVGDALDVVMNPQNYEITTKFDCVILDVYAGGKQANSFSTQSFFNKLTDLVENSGLVVINKIVYKDHQDITSYINTLNEFLKDVKIERIKYPSIADNYIFCGRVG